MIKIGCCGLSGRRRFGPLGALEAVQQLVGCSRTVAERLVVVVVADVEVVVAAAAVWRVVAERTIARNFEIATRLVVAGTTLD